MKRLTVFILLLAVSLPDRVFGCYFYPYGEDIRFSIFNPDNFNYNGFRIYNYTSTYFYDENYTTNLNTVTNNDLMWFNHCKKQIPVVEIKKAIFEIDISEVSPNSKNRFIQYLYQHKDFQTINYLLFAKEVEKLNIDGDDLWENNTNLKDKLRNNKVDEAFKRIKQLKHTTLQKRYYYQIFKLLSYMGQPERTVKLYEAYSKIYKPTDFLDDWALFYRMNAEPDDVKMNYLAAQVFARGTDNKFDIKWYFNKNIPIERVLKFATSPQEMANIHVLYSFKKLDYNLDNIQKVYQCDPGNQGLSFLLLREINKMEDWILTPTYTMYLPTLREDYWENSNEQRILNRVEVDRKYAAKVLDFVNTVNIDKVDDKAFWQLSKAYLEFLTKDYSKALKTISLFESKPQNKKLKAQCDMIKALVLTANQEKRKAIIPPSVQTVLMREANLKSYAFLFAVAKELEILENKVDAAFLISKIKPDEYDNSNTFWKSRSGKITLFDDFYFDWYGYADAELSTNDMQLLINELNAQNNTEFALWKKNDLLHEKNKVNDLMGIKYMRDDNLKMAYHFFLKVNNNHYTNAPMFNENPFYQIKGYMNFDPAKTTIHYNKAKVVQTLMQLKAKAANVKNKNRHKEYLLIANCYYNMSYYGNSWMMKRIGRTANRDANYDDQREYYCCDMAKSFYKKAYDSSKSAKFKALCVYMMSKCKARENEFLLIQQYERYYYVAYNEMNKVNDAAFKDFRKQYPNEYDELTSNCEIFSVYFNARK